MWEILTMNTLIFYKLNFLVIILNTSSTKKTYVLSTQNAESAIL
jgi:hypothetical protein